MSPFKKIAAAILLGLLSLSASAQTVQPALPKATIAHPSLWHVQGEAGQVYLLGSVHVLPPNVQWRTRPIATALSCADVYVFEVPEDDAAVKSSGLDPAGLDRERPWLAGLQMMFAQIAKLNYAVSNGVDAVLMQSAIRGHKQVRYLETIAEQFALLAPDDPVLELQEFEAGLGDLRDVSAGIHPMIQAWSDGDQARLDELINGDLDQFPQARKILLDDRNARWVPKIEAMLKEKHIFFVTVGAGHLTGPKGVPALLRKAGYKVTGP